MKAGTCYPTFDQIFDLSNKVINVLIRKVLAVIRKSLVLVLLILKVILHSILLLSQSLQLLLLQHLAQLQVVVVMQVIQIKQIIIIIVGYVILMVIRHYIVQHTQLLKIVKLDASSSLCVVCVHLCNTKQRIVMVIQTI